LETGGNHGGLVYADISALVRLLVRSARQAKIGELLKSIGIDGSIAGRNRPADFKEGG
jgi:hypothetical protein